MIKKTHYSKFVFTKIFSSVSVISTLLLSACTNKNDNVIRLALPFANTDTRYQLWTKMVTAYNSSISTKDNKTGKLPVVLNSTGNYENNSQVLKNQLNANDPYIPNLSLGYGINVYAANQLYYRAFDFTKSTAQDYPKDVKAKAYQNDGITLNTYEKLFTKVNDYIGGVKQGGLYLIPMGASTDLMFWNKPVLNYLLNEAIKQNIISFKTDSTDDKYWFEGQLGIKIPETKSSEVRQTNVSTIGTDYQPDPELMKSIKATYGEMKKPTNETTLQVTRADFQSYTKLFKLLNVLLSSLTHKQPLLAFVQSNLLELMSFLKGNTDYNNFIFNKQGDMYQYKFLKDSNGTLGKNLKDSYELIQKNIGNGGVWNTKAATPTTDFKQGKLAFYIKSNSKYKSLFDNKANSHTNLHQKDVLVTQAPFYYDDHASHMNEKGAFWVQGGALFGIKSNSPTKDHATRLFVQWLTSKDQNHGFSLDNDQNATKYNPSDWYALKSGYVPGSTNFWTNTYEQNLKTLNNINEAAASTYQIFASSTEISGIKHDPKSEAMEKSITDVDYDWGFKKQSNLVGFVEPVGELSQTFRSFSDKNGAGQTTYPTFEQYWSNLKSNSTIDSYLKSGQR